MLTHAGLTHIWWNRELFSYNKWPLFTCCYLTDLYIFKVAIKIDVGYYHFKESIPYFNIKFSQNDREGVYTCMLKAFYFVIGRVFIGNAEL